VHLVYSSIGTNVSNVYTDERVKEKKCASYPSRHEEQEGVNSGQKCWLLTEVRCHIRSCCSRGLWCRKRIGELPKHLAQYSGVLNGDSKRAAWEEGTEVNACHVVADL
jgi:hypothetical protein